MKYFIDEKTKEVYGYSQDQQELIDVAISNGFKDISNNWPIPAPQKSEIVILDSVQKLQKFLKNNPDVYALLNAQ